VTFSFFREILSCQRVELGAFTVKSERMAANWRLAPVFSGQIMSYPIFPFSAIVEQKALKTALILNAVDPSIGGVLIRGQKGTGKSTAARALAQLLPPIAVLEDSPFNIDPENPIDFSGIKFPHGRRRKAKVAMRPMPFVELPLNATEDRLVGSLHIEKALQTGERRFEPGLLAAANRGILYVDEVNLLADHLVDMLLDSAASKVNRIERESISFIHPAHFMLIGTMNPEEGELRPQFLDRFGLCVEVEGVLDLDSRKLIVERNLAYERDPERFFSEWLTADRIMSNQIMVAREQLNHVVISDELVTSIVSLTRELQLQGHRADITIYKAARAHAALMEKGEIGMPDIFEASQFAIQHRMKSAAFDPPKAVRQKIHDTLCRLLKKDQDASAKLRQDEVTDIDDMAESIQVPGAAAAGSLLFSFLGSKQVKTVFEPDTSIAPTGIDVVKLLKTKKEGKRKSKAEIEGSSGRYLRSEPIDPTDKEYRIAVDATLRQAAVRTAREGVKSVRGSPLKKSDLRKKRLLQKCRHLIVFVVDSSGSMGSGKRIPMKAAKGAVLAILREAHSSKSEVAMVTFGGRSSKIVLRPTSSVEVAAAALERLPSGGATPFAESLSQAWQLIRSERLKNPGVRPILVAISDGEANIPASAGAEPQDELESLVEKMGRDQIKGIFIDAGSRKNCDSPMKRFAGRMRARYLSMDTLSASSVLEALNDNA